MASDATTHSSPSLSPTPSSSSSVMSSGVLVQPEDGSPLSTSQTDTTASSSADLSTHDRQQQKKQRTRQRSNSLGADPRGDTGAAALATLQSAPFMSSSGPDLGSGSGTGTVSNRISNKLRSSNNGGGMNTPLDDKNRQQQQRHTARTSKRRKARTLLRRWKSISQRHTWLNPLIICLLVVSVYLVNPGPENPVHKALFLSYPVEVEISDAGSDGFSTQLGYDANGTISYAEQPVADTIPIGTARKTMYDKGPADFAFVAFYTIFLSFTREFIMQRILRPIANSTALRPHLRSRAKQARFMEQAYTAIYFGILGPFGLYVMRYQSPLWYFNTRAMYVGFPHRLHQATFKAYYLIEASYWLQQMGVLLLMLEKPRKDFKELVAHHIITLALIGLSYRFHFTYMGLAVYITHDVSDFFLATSKILNYTSSSLLAPYFATFIAIWTYLRHYINLRILVSVFTEFPTVGPFTLDWQGHQYKCRLSQTIVFTLLASLQAINLFWFVLILRIAVRFVGTLTGKDGGGAGAGGGKGGGVRDIRSDDEDDDEDDVVEDEDKDGGGVKEKEREKRDEHMKDTKEKAAPPPRVLVNGSPLEPADTATMTTAAMTGTGTGTDADTSNVNESSLPRQRKNKSS